MGSLNYRSTDEYYSFLLYLELKVGKYFDIFVNGERIEKVAEDMSLYKCKSGTLEFVCIDISKKRKRKSINGFWKQNGEENFLPVKLSDSNLKTTKRNFTKISHCGTEIIRDKSFKCWEYSLFNGGDHNHLYNI
ncbi:hypothetical protein DICPUDRAFT_78560 [Dictyostelium purpureum]|uniref:Uncharacterized protein n=1 Tax=Dictyostelium purpureum TaxID=5786 RepID=F0ZJX2_DICPU|nr:uncharacterized protein DICPUDRAFT_78560 [Dictyostelium purpureum]EGC35767.1 hypothetical protein DICPUDRAFT_78560 [Dictyostelium purpureum]|eukprot:XP_003287719.1 hypothetical protein DICPUDRAFT_78560 [Dictyostelium purpureum]